uniref:Activation-induced cytidine deaminase n=1 Tax=Poecilia formosa TaxID=48698 RepID=A0A087XZI4_POEFO
RKVSYSVTWFCSWSPCANCSIRLAQFLHQTPNLRLRIFVSRLYFCDLEDSREREGLRILKKAGVHITVMSYKDYFYCWQTFVAKSQSKFKPWDGLHQNYIRLSRKLNRILQPALDIKKFIYHYKNLRWARGRCETYLCFVVKKKLHLFMFVIVGRNRLFDLNVTMNNKSLYLIPLHLQLLFLRHLGALCPGLWGYGVTGERKVSYSVTWFCSWSPCANCSIRLAQFLHQTPNLRLRIFVSRLYFCDLEDSREREGLRILKKAGVHITVMSYKDYFYCWQTFVAKSQSKFKPWDGLHQNYIRLSRKLNRILQVQFF